MPENPWTGLRNLVAVACAAAEHGGIMLAHEALPTPPPARDRTIRQRRTVAAARATRPAVRFPAKRMMHHLVLRRRCDVGVARPGRVANVFAIECFMDELAERAGVDPVEYRLSLMSDPRAGACSRTWRNAATGHRVVRPAADAGWARLGRYKNKAAYAGVAVEVEVDQEVRLRRVWCAADAGLVINPDGARNQLEGGIVQAVSMTLKEQVAWRATASRRSTGPVIRSCSSPKCRRSHRDHPCAGPADARHGRMHVRTDRGGDRQCGRTRARGAHHATCRSRAIAEAALRK